MGSSGLEVIAALFRARGVYIAVWFLSERFICMC